MNKYNALFKHSRLIISFTICLTLLGIGVWSSASSRKQRSRPLEEIRKDLVTDQIKLDNKTQGFEILRMDKTQMGDILLSLKNNYAKRITGFQVTVGAARIQTELILGGDENEFISPGAIYEKVYFAQEGLDEQGIVVRAVVFEDGTSDGEPDFIKEIKDYRVGMKLERERVLARLHYILSSTQTDILADLEKLELDTLSLTQGRRYGKLDNIALGSRNERKRILDEIKNFRRIHLKLRSHREQENESDYRKNLAQLVEFYKNIIAKAKT